MKNATYKMTVTEKNLYGHKFTTYGIQGVNVRFDDISTDRKKVKEIDPGAFIIVTTSSEIIGRGFRSV